ncbi:MAG: phosphatase PAP2 family protein [Actinobacteria bacterium]|nr:MAG: phosphatase PAP2 family protein [Actinomycetota bacterium]TMM11477.1 MAG: phosphatase PAP2 family protein [Actinomycetota bacterium]
MTRTWYWSSRWLPRGWVDALRQLTLFAGAYYAYRIVRGIVDGQTTVAFDHARSIVDIEKGVGLFFEPGLQHWALGRPWLIDAADWSYVNSHFLVTTTFLIWLYLARNRAFYFVRNMFMVAMALALVGYLVFPAAPPRLLPEWGFTDTVTNAVGQSQANTAKLLFNPYAAMPSMHVAFALMIAIPAIKVTATRALRYVWAFYPAFVTLVVMVTANHFWLDAAGGLLVATISAYAAYAVFGRARPEAWAWNTGPTPAEAPA